MADQKPEAPIPIAPGCRSWGSLDRGSIRQPFDDTFHAHLRDATVRGGLAKRRPSVVILTNRPRAAWFRFRKVELHISVPPHRPIHSPQRHVTTFVRSLRLLYQRGPVSRPWVDVGRTFPRVTAVEMVVMTTKNAATTPITKAVCASVQFTHSKPTANATIARTNVFIESVIAELKATGSRSLSLSSVSNPFGMLVILLENRSAGVQSQNRPHERSVLKRFVRSL